MQAVAMASPTMQKPNQFIFSMTRDAQTVCSQRRVIRVAVADTLSGGSICHPHLGPASYLTPVISRTLQDFIAISTTGYTSHHD
jgi:hypothetical protein